MRRAHRAETAWRSVAIVASVAGIALLPVFRNMLGDDRIGIYVAFGLPFAIGLAAMAVPMETRTRILGLWLASLMAGFVAMISLWSGFGFVAIGVTVVYLLAAWGLNEASGSSATHDRRV